MQDKLSFGQWLQTRVSFNIEKRVLFYSRFIRLLQGNHVFFFLGGGAFSGVGNAFKHHLYEVVMSLCREQDSAFRCLGP